LRVSAPQRLIILALLSLFLVCFAASAFAVTFDDLLGEFAQRRSGVCVLYGHVMSFAEVYPESIVKMCNKVFGGWMVTFPDGRRVYVAQDDIDKSLKDGWAAGEPDNLLLIVSIALDIRVGGFNFETGQLGYGKNEFAQFIGTGNWTGYGEESGPDHTLWHGFQRLAKETGPDGKLKLPATIGFGLLDKKHCPKYAEKCEKYKLVGGHDFSMIGYNPATKCARLRNPHRPKEIIEVPVKLLLKIPCGMDFLETHNIVAEGAQAHSPTIND
jgi:hypothetical protein